jgi:hypothetical protein
VDGRRESFAEAMTTGAAAASDGAAACCSSLPGWSPPAPADAIEAAAAAAAAIMTTRISIRTSFEMSRRTSFLKLVAKPLRLFGDSLRFKIPVRKKMLIYQ